MTTQTDVIDFVEKGVLGESAHSLYPAQRVALKAMYGIPLDDKTPVVPVYQGKWLRTGERKLTEAAYLRYLADDGRANVDTIEEGQFFSSLNLSKGRRSGGTFLSGLVLAWELYSLLRSQPCPQDHYGMFKSSILSLLGVSVNKDLSGMLYETTMLNIRQIGWFDSRRGAHTQTYATFQTDTDMEALEAAKRAEAAGVELVHPATVYNHATVKLQFRSAVAKGLRGCANKIVVADEVAFFDRPMEVYQALLPSTLSFGAEGRWVAISNPNGKQLDDQGKSRCPFFRQFQRSMEGEVGALCLQIPTWEMNPTVPAEHFERMLDLSGSAVFDAEYGARFQVR